MLSVIGVSHRSAPVEIRERIAFGDSELPEALRVLGHGVILSTCNRTEIYCTDDQRGTLPTVRQFLASRLNDDSAQLAPHLYELSGESAPFAAFEDLVPALRESDIVISSTDAHQPVISRVAVAAAMAERNDRALFLVDIAVPRDVEPDVRSLPNVHLYDIDDLCALCDHSRQARRNEVQRVQSIVDEETARLTTWWRVYQAVPTVVALRNRVEAIRRDELAEALGRLPDLNDADRAIVDALTRAIVNKLLHRPTKRLKEAAGVGDETVSAAVRDLFAVA